MLAVNLVEFVTFGYM